MAESLLLAFCSIDVIGSTAFKTQKDRSEASEQAWFQFFREFHAETRSFMESGSAWRFWKSAGDELLFTAELHHEHDIIDLVNKLVDAIKRHNAGFNLPEKEKDLAVKGALWLAGFPVVNAIIPDDDKKTGPDYLGPSIDSGFRICRFATATKIAVSVEAAYLLSSVMSDPQWGHIEGIRYGGDTMLKGVFGGNPYPMLWILLDDPLEKAALKLMGHRASPDRQDLRHFCEEAIKKVNNEFVSHLPYIVSVDGKVGFGCMPSTHTTRKLYIDKKEQTEQAIEDGEKEENMTGDNPPEVTLQAQLKQSIPPK